MTDQRTPETAGERADAPTTWPLGRTLAWVGVVATSAIVAFIVVMLVLRRAAPGADDETTERIQALIDEANRLIKALDEKRHA